MVAAGEGSPAKNNIFDIKWREERVAKCKMAGTNNRRKSSIWQEGMDSFLSLEKEVMNLTSFHPKARERTTIKKVRQQHDNLP
jgi:hypothetical protein